MYLAVVPASLAHLPPFRTRRSLRIAADAAGINPVALVKTSRNAGVLGNVTIGKVYVTELRFRSVVNRPAHDRHHGSIA